MADTYSIVKIPAFTYTNKSPVQIDKIRIVAHDTNGVTQQVAISNVDTGSDRPQDLTLNDFFGEKELKRQEINWDSSDNTTILKEESSGNTFPVSHVKGTQYPIFANPGYFFDLRIGNSDQFLITPCATIKEFLESYNMDMSKKFNCSLFYVKLTDLAITLYIDIYLYTANYELASDGSIVKDNASDPDYLLLDTVTIKYNPIDLTDASGLAGNFDEKYQVNQFYTPAWSYNASTLKDKDGVKFDFKLKCPNLVSEGTWNDLKKPLGLSKGGTATGGSVTLFDYNSTTHKYELVGNPITSLEDVMTFTYPMLYKCWADYYHDSDAARKARQNGTQVYHMVPIGIPFVTNLKDVDILENGHRIIKSSNISNVPGSTLYPVIDNQTHKYVRDYSFAYLTTEKQESPLPYIDISSWAFYNGQTGSDLYANKRILSLYRQSFPTNVLSKVDALLNKAKEWSNGVATAKWLRDKNLFITNLCYINNTNTFSTIYKEAGNNDISTKLMLFYRGDYTKDFRESPSAPAFDYWFSNDDNIAGNSKVCYTDAIEGQGSLYNDDMLVRRFYGQNEKNGSLHGNWVSQVNANNIAETGAYDPDKVSSNNSSRPGTAHILINDNGGAYTSSPWYITDCYRYLQEYLLQHVPGAIKKDSLPGNIQRQVLQRTPTAKVISFTPFGTLNSSGTSYTKLSDVSHLYRDSNLEVSARNVNTAADKTLMVRYAGEVLDVYTQGGLFKDGACAADTSTTFKLNDSLETLKKKGSVVDISNFDDYIVRTDAIVIDRANSNIFDKENLAGTIQTQIDIISPTDRTKNLGLYQGTTDTGNAAFKDVTVTDTLTDTTSNIYEWSGGNVITQLTPRDNKSSLSCSYTKDYKLVNTSIGCGYLLSFSIKNESTDNQIYVVCVNAAYQTRALINGVYYSTNNGKIEILVKGGATVRGTIVKSQMMTGLTSFPMRNYGICLVIPNANSAEYNQYVIQNKYFERSDHASETFAVLNAGTTDNDLLLAHSAVVYPACLTYLENAKCYDKTYLFRCLPESFMSEILFSYDINGYKIDNAFREHDVFLNDITTVQEFLPDDDCIIREYNE